MRKASFPPIVILLDFLFIFLFVITQKESKTVDIHIPEDKLFHTAEIFHPNSEKSTKHENSFLLDCGNQLECKNAKSKYDGEVFIYIPPSLFKKISEMTFFAFESDSAKCGKLSIYISAEGELDIPKIFDQNKCLNKIPNLRQLYEQDS
ncbi:MAG: hypothetical protein BWK73_33245 [Thiothrix lacustris]|uniref:Uncharacterized protein n=1 Tax=Thiothrix lacustris TaxID=525917 RepID=A0A1Y1QHD5_9GAMM|nr:MAG: hypothetical protein BWK73_33245 [Thiothrix lacustris]